jgi:hypothetical protein
MVVESLSRAISRKGNEAFLGKFTVAAPGG